MAIEIKNSNTFDVRKHPDVSSMGNLDWPPEGASDARNKFFLRDVLTMEENLVSFLDKFSSLQITPSVTRISGRVVVTETMMPKFVQLYHPFVETIIPLAGGGVAEDCCLIYIGKNDSQRMSPPDTLQLQYNRADACFRDAGAAKKQADFFLVRRLQEAERSSPEIIKQFFALYQAFQWSIDDVMRILGGPNNLIMAAFGTE